MASKELARVPSDKGLLYLNKWAFCPHGYECCNLCLIDTRYLNDGTAEEGKVADPDYRKGLSVAGRFLVRTKKKSAALFLCNDHSTRDCPKCFNWEKFVKANAKKKNSGKVEDRDWILRLLAILGISIPEFSKLDQTALEKKLTISLDYAQNFVLFSDILPLVPTDLPEWKSTSSSSLPDPGQGEMSILENLLTKGISDRSSKDIEYIQETVSLMAQHYKGGTDTYILRDANQHMAIGLRVLGAYMLNAAMPLVSMVFKAGTGDELAKIKTLLTPGAKAKNVSEIICSLDQLALLRRILFRNSARLSPQYSPRRHGAEKDFTTSFVLPLFPLRRVQVGLIAHNPGCAVCGKLQTTRCSACVSERYCSSECQKAHWKDHKPLCQSVRDGKWATFRFNDTEMVNGERRFRQTIDTNTSPREHMKKYERVMRGEPPENVHGDRVFLIQIHGMGSDVQIHDRTRSIQSHIYEKDNAERFRELLPRPTTEVWDYSTDGNPYLAYRWAKRTGDWQLSICLDRKLSENTSW